VSWTWDCSKDGIESAYLEVSQQEECWASKLAMMESLLEGGVEGDETVEGRHYEDGQGQSKRQKRSAAVLQDSSDINIERLTPAKKAKVVGKGKGRDIDEI
jgi:hypothetical protein